MYDDFSVKDFMSVQPMTEKPLLSIPMEFLDGKNPKIGQIFPDVLKSPPCGCCRSYWYKIWTGKEWVCERKVSPMEWRNIVIKLHQKK